MTTQGSAIGLPIEQGFYTLILGIHPEGKEEPLYFYNPNDDRVNGCTIYGVSMHESITDIIPTCKIEVEIPYFWLDKQYITDGTRISIQMKPYEKLLEKYPQIKEEPYIYRLFNIEKLEDHGFFVRIILGGVIDFLPGYGDANQLNCNCTTSHVFDEFAKKFGFSQTDIDETSDKQLWISNGRTIYQFLSYCCQYGYINNTSAMMWAIDRNKKLYYKDIVSLFNADQSSSNKNKTKTCQNCQTIRVGSLGVSVVSSLPFGLNNVKYGAYGANGNNFDLAQGESCKYDYNNIETKNLKKTSESTCICKNGGCVQAQDWFPFNVGNHNENYFRAVMQNRQILSSYSTFLSVRFTPSTAIVAKNSIIPFFEAFHLFDTHNLEYVVDVKKEKFINMFALTSKCIVETIDVNITQSHAATNVKFVMQGINTKGNTN